MADRLSPEDVRERWREQAVVYGQSAAASWSDIPAMSLEIAQIAHRLKDGDYVIDVGCGNGYSTLRYAAQKRVIVRGIDYIPEMIAEARRQAGTLEEQIGGRVRFEVGNIGALAEPDASYDVLVSVRVVINLPNWETQLAALAECVRVLKPGGRLLLSEATLQGWRNLNAFRKEWHLAEIPMPPFNLYLDQDRVVEAMSAHCDLIELVNFSSTYYIGTRVLKPVLAQALGIDLDVANPDMEWNRWFAELPAWGDYGTQKLFVFRKR
jgi:SAM-dependent methyltransferase